MIDSHGKRMERRAFVKAAGALSAMSLLRPLAAQGVGAAGAKLFMTSATKKHEAIGTIPFRESGGGNTSVDQIRVDPSQRYQPMLGFGSAYTDASLFLLNSIKPEARQKFLRETFSPQQMNLSVGRTSIGASDYSRNVYSYDDTADDVSMRHFSIAHDESYILPMLREMRSINPDLFLLSTPWSPPGWMKTYGSMLGGLMTNRSLGAYSLYIGRFLDAYRAAGVPINAVTSQNEPGTDQGGSMPATSWTPELESDFIRDHLGPLLKKKGDTAQIWLLDHNYDMWKRVRWQMRDPELRKYVSGVAWHGYVGTPDMMSRLHEAEPDLPFYWTEGGPDVNDPNYTSDWTRWGRTFTAAIGNWCRCIMTWNLMLDPEGKPNIGPFSCGGLVTVNSKSELIHSGQYWTLRHFSQHVRRGAIRVGSHSDASELSHIAFENVDGSQVVVVTNSGEERELRLSYKNSEVLIPLDKNSVATIVS